MIRSVFSSELVVLLGLLSISALAYSQPPKGDEVLCYKSSIKEPLTFYGNPSDTFTLSDDSKWRVAIVGPYEYVPLRYRNVLICPTEEILIVDKKALPIKKLSI